MIELWFEKSLEIIDKSIDNKEVTQKVLNIHQEKIKK
jgi:hypothetical protein